MGRAKIKKNWKKVPGFMQSDQKAGKHWKKQALPMSWRRRKIRMRDCFMQYWKKVSYDLCQYHRRYFS